MTQESKQNPGLSTLASLREHSIVVADSGDIDAIAEYQPQDATTNPSLILKEVEKGSYPEVLSAASQGLTDVREIADNLIVQFGLKILDKIPGRVSTEVDARLSFDTEATIAKARKIITMYQDAGIARDRVLIKIASTWEGLAAARVLEAEGIHCNMTLIFSLSQAAVAADARVALISPFVGRILDWYKKSEQRDSYPVDDDPGVRSVRAIYHYIRHQGSNTEVMGASFRNLEQIIALAGCDLLTIAPSLLAELAELDKQLPEAITHIQPDDVVEACDTSETAFRWAMNEDAMASDLLAEGIRRFAVDQGKLEKLLKTAN